MKINKQKGFNTLNEQCVVYCVCCNYVVLSKYYTQALRIEVFQGWKLNIMGNFHFVNLLCVCVCKECLFIYFLNFLVQVCVYAVDLSNKKTANMRFIIKH